jgi:hypothetical protein
MIDAVVAASNVRIIRASVRAPRGERGSRALHRLDPPRTPRPPHVINQRPASAVLRQYGTSAAHIVPSARPLPFDPLPDRAARSFMTSDGATDLAD